MPQPGFFDLDDRYRKLDEKDPLIHLDRLIFWVSGHPEPYYLLHNPAGKLALKTNDLKRANYEHINKT